MEILNPFEKLLVGLADAEVIFLVVGGIACALSGHVRATEDVDILVDRSSENIKKLLSYLSHYGEGFASELTESDFTDEEGAIRIIEEFPIDIFTVMAGNHIQDLDKLSEVTDIDGRRIKYLSAAGLIKLKSNSVREKDKWDVQALSEIVAQKK